MNFLNEFLYPALLAILTAILGYIVSLLKDNRKVSDANAKGTMLLLRRQIMDSHHRFCELGEPMSAFDFKDIDEVHDAYKALGGNGLTDKMYQDLKSLEIGKE